MLDLICLRRILDQICVPGNMGVDVMVDANDVACCIFELGGRDGHCTSAGSMRTTEESISLGREMCRDIYLVVHVIPPPQNGDHPRFKKIRHLFRRDPELCPTGSHIAAQIVGRLPDPFLPAVDLSELLHVAWIAESSDIPLEVGQACDTLGKDKAHDRQSVEGVTWA